VICPLKVGDDWRGGKRKEISACKFQMFDNKAKGKIV